MFAVLKIGNEIFLLVLFFSYVCEEIFKLCESCHVNDKNCIFCKNVASFYKFLQSFSPAKILNSLLVPTIL
jgi:hypothetical protein